MNNTEIEYMSSEDFRKMIIEAREDFTDLQLAGYLRTSIRTIEKWAAGTAAEYPLGRKAVKDKIQSARGY